MKFLKSLAERPSRRRQIREGFEAAIARAHRALRDAKAVVEPPPQSGSRLVTNGK